MRIVFVGRRLYSPLPSIWATAKHSAALAIAIAHSCVRKKSTKPSPFYPFHIGVNGWPSNLFFLNNLSVLFFKLFSANFIIARTALKIWSQLSHMRCFFSFPCVRMTWSPSLVAHCLFMRIKKKNAPFGQQYRMPQVPFTILRRHSREFAQRGSIFFFFQTQILTIYPRLAEVKVSVSIKHTVLFQTRFVLNGIF